MKLSRQGASAGKTQKHQIGKGDAGRDGQEYPAHQLCTVICYAALMQLPSPDAGLHRGREAPRIDSASMRISPTTEYGMTSRRD
jgi:hypothetical protein